MVEPNLKPEQIARETIDGLLRQSGWIVQSKNKIDFSAGAGIAIREYQTDVGPADYVLFVDRAPVGVIEAKPEDWGPEAHDRRGAVRWVRGRPAQMGQRQQAAPFHL